MKAILLLLLSASILFVVPLKTLAQYNSEEMLYVHKVEKYRKMKNAGRILTFGGTVLTIVGVVAVANAPKTQTTNGYGQTVTTIDESGFGGALAFIAGAASLGAGIPLWIVGSKAEAKYRRKLGDSYLSLNINYQQVGLTWRYQPGRSRR